jgi:hypothetical protein
MQLDKGESARAINGHQQVEPVLLGMHLGDVDVEVADGIALELLVGRPPLTSGKRLMPWRWRQRYRAERVTCGMVGWRA